MNRLHVLSIIARHCPGVLARVTGLFGRRGYNIEYMNAGPTKNPQIYNVTVMVEGDDHVIDQIKKQLEKLIDIIQVSDVVDKKEFSAEDRIKKKAYIKAIERKEMIK